MIPFIDSYRSSYGYKDKMSLIQQWWGRGKVKMKQDYEFIAEAEWWVYEGTLYYSFCSWVIFEIFHNKKNFRYIIHHYSKSYTHASLPCFHINGWGSFNHILISPCSDLPIYLATVTNICMPSFQTMDVMPHAHSSRWRCHSKFIPLPAHKQRLHFYRHGFLPHSRAPLFYFHGTVHSSSQIPL